MRIPTISLKSDLDSPRGELEWDGALDVDTALTFARSQALAGLRPGGGHTRDLFETLAALGAADLGVARAVEPHLDAIAILDQAGVGSSAGASTWGVFAAEGGEPLVATPGPSGWTLQGQKPWCSLADRLDNALITATLESGVRQLFAVELRSAGVSVMPNVWPSRGLTEIPSGPVAFNEVPAIPIGEAGWYLTRPGFAWGGIAVAACWFGGAVGLARTLYAAIAARDSVDDLASMHLGRVDEVIESSRRALAEAAELIDSGVADGVAGSVLTKRVRATVANAVETVMLHCGHALGPAPLASSAEHAKRVADLTLYVRQHHAERDEASLGRALLGFERSPW